VILMKENDEKAQSGEERVFHLDASRQFPEWLAEQGCGLAFTTYQASKLFLIGLLPNDTLSVFERTIDRCMGLAADRDSLFVSSLYQVWQFENALNQAELTEDGYDRVYLPQVGYVTGDCDIHDMAVERDGRLVFVNTLFSCLATLSDTASFSPLWHPPFISRLAAEDRCHLNGLAMRDGKPAFVTAISESDVADGWRDKRADGGVVVDVATNDVVARGLSMPHSPRWYRGRLWLLNSGTGEFGSIDLQDGTFEPVCFAPGYLRGLSFVGRYAVMGLSLPRHNQTFQDLPLDKTLASKNADPRCGVLVVDLETGDAVHWIRIEGVVNELYDVSVLPDCRRPMAIGFQSDEIRRAIAIGESQELKHFAFNL